MIKLTRLFGGIILDCCPARVNLDRRQGQNIEGKGTFSNSVTHLQIN